MKQKATYVASSSHIRVFVVGSTHAGLGRRFVEAGDGEELVTQERDWAPIGS